MTEMAPSSAAAAAAMRRRESNLTLDGEDEARVEVEPVAERWMTHELFKTLWGNATMQVSSSCSITTRRRRASAVKSGPLEAVQPLTRSAEDNSTALSTDGAETPPAAASAGFSKTPSKKQHYYEAHEFQEMLLSALGDDIVVFPAEDMAGERLVVFAYASVSDNYGLRTVLLLRLEQLHRSEQVAISIKNTDPIDRTRMNAFLSIIQQRLQPGEAPKRPHSRMVDTDTLFLDENSDDQDSTDSAVTPPTRKAAEQPTPAQTARARSISRSNSVVRGRSHTIRYRTERSISFEGYLNKKSDLLPNWKVTYCVLEEDTLAYYESREDFISNSKLIGRVHIQAVQDDDTGKPNGFLIMTEGHHINHLSSRTAFEKEQWKRAITIAISRTPEMAHPHVAFASQPLDPHKFYQLLGALLRQEIDDFPMLFRSVHPDVVVTSNFPPIVPFWGQYRRYDGVLLFISTLLESVMVESFSMTEVIQLVRGDADCIDGFVDTNDASTPVRSLGDLVSHELSPKGSGANMQTPDSALTPSAQWERRLVVTGKETYNLVNFENRRITQLFVHELWLDHKDRLVRWHLNGDSVALSVAFDDAPRGENIRLVLPGETSAISHSIPRGTFYVQVLRAQQLTPADATSSSGTSSSGGLKKSHSTSSSASASAKKPYSVYARCILEEGTHFERTLEGLGSNGDKIPDELARTNGHQIEKKRPSKGTRLFRGLRRAAGISGERTFGKYGDPSGCVTSTCRCATSEDGHGNGGQSLNPEWASNLRLEFPGCVRGFTYFLKVEVFQSRFMLPDELLGVCKINLTPHLSLVNASADAKANGALPRWHNLCDQYNDCKESWAPPTVFRGRIQLGIIFAPTILSADGQVDPKVQGIRRLASDGSILPNRRSSADETLLQNMSSYDLRELLRSEKLAEGHPIIVSSTRAANLFSQPTGRWSLHAGSISSVVSSGDLTSQDSSGSIDDELRRLARDNHIFKGKRTLFDVPKKYQMIKAVGAGTYGEVIAASDVESGSTVAIKKIANAFQDLPDTRRILREMCLLRQLSHPNLIQLYDIPRPERLSYLEDIYLVTDLMETDLHRVIHSTQTLTDEHVAHFMRQMLRGLAYLHSANILHRDLKPSNILVTSTCDVKICDLGLARYVDYSKATRKEGAGGVEEFVELTEYVVTRWYRAPEILLDGCRYDKASDLWSAGCILAELLGRKPLFPGSSTTNQLNKIFNVLGTPDTHYISRIYKPAAQKWMQRQRRRARIGFSELYPNANELALDLLEKLLTYDPHKRITAAEALRHPYLKEAFRSVIPEGIDTASSETGAYSEAEEKEDVFIGKIDDSNERVPLEKPSMQAAVFEQMCYFHPEAREYEDWLKEHDEKFCVDPATGKLVPINNGA